MNLRQSIVGDVSESSAHNPSEAKHASESDALAVVLRLREAGHVAYFAGGCVRDMLLGLTPKDYDVATDAPPGRVRELFKSTQAVGAAFGVILVRAGKSVIEVATFRTDLKYVDGRRPEGVVFTTAEEDAKRRDFTINGLFFDPAEKKVIDFVGGQKDLENKIIRAIGQPEHRFEEDHLRMLRAIRFAARFNFRIHGATINAIVKYAEHLKRISPERISQELRLMLVPQTRDVAYEYLAAAGLIDVILLRFLPEYPKRAHPHAPRGLISALGPPLHYGNISFGLAMAAIVLMERERRFGNSLSPEEVRRSANAVRKALRVSNEEYDVIVGSLSFEHLIRERLPSVAAMKRSLAMPASGDAQLLMAAVARVEESSVRRERIEQVLDRLRVLARGDFAPPPFVTGDDLTAAGLSPGPVFKRVLDAVYNAQLEGRIRTKAAALELALSLVTN